ncbi:hypothetical protein ANO14919_046060 [Xylariales sp. No.14919]|nr:hypothetical protein ANO14919_046060 [Xylariales sp. No.14919]
MQENKLPATLTASRISGSKRESHGGRVLGNAANSDALGAIAAYFCPESTTATPASPTLD